MTAGVGGGDVKLVCVVDMELVGEGVGTGRATGVDDVWG